MKTNLFLVRHGQTRLTADHFAGMTDVPLSEEGRAQASQLGQRFKGIPINAIYSSPFQRTMATAQSIAEHHHLSVIAESAFAEINHGHWETMTRNDAREKFPQEYQAWDADPFSHAPLKGETGKDVLDRSMPALLRLLEVHRGETIVVVAHKNIIRLAIGAILAVDLRNYRRSFDQDHAALNLVCFNEQNTLPQLLLYNDTSHYQTLRPLL